MREMMIATAIVVLLGVVGLIPTLEFDTGVRLGTLLLAAGALLGIPAGGVYHWLLHSELKRRNAVERGWYWDPMRYHHLVPKGPRALFERWFFVGGVGFVVLMLGLVVIGVSMVAEVVRYTP